ncbi:AAA domain-containing protein [Caldanaerobacter subterraneus KAk]|nr:AAA domain-containing protein [Caldanaerobacter subterraneus]
MGRNENLQLARERLIRLYSFLREFSRIRYSFPTHVKEHHWRLWFSELPDHPSISCGYFLTSEKPRDSASEIEEGEFVLRVRRPKLTKPPAPPESIKEWLQSGWENPFNQDVFPIASKNIELSDGTSAVEHFEDDKKRVEEFERWRKLWKEWAANERPARHAMKVFESLYELYGHIQREGERVELMLGDGILSWKIEGREVYYPVLLMPVQLEFDADVPEFRIIDTGANPQLYTAAFRHGTEVDLSNLASIQDEWSKGGFHPLGGDDTSGFLRRLVVALSPHGDFIGEKLPPEGSMQPVIGRSPLIFLRQRTLGFTLALDRILEDLPNRKDLPAFLARIVGIDLSEGKGETPEKEYTELPGSEPEEILFSKPWNKEQLKIAERLENYSAVLVQGPPGTGKTHTIANLIGHLLAQGKSVLVTAHTSKALKVLRDKIVEPLRPLCVSVLDNDLESRKQLEEAVNHIVEQLSQGDARTLEEKAKDLSIQRSKLKREIQTLQQHLLDAIGSEYRPIVIGGDSYDPCEAARLVTKGKGIHDWIPGPVELGEPLPLSIPELVELYQTNGAVTPEEEQELLSGLPSPENLVSPERFAELSEILSHSVNSFGSEFWYDGVKGQEIIGYLDELAKEAKEIGKELLEAENWELVVVDSGIRGKAYCEPWNNLIKLLGDIEELKARSQELFILHRPRLADNIPFEEQERLAITLAEEASRRGGISGFSLIFHPAWRKFLQKAGVASGQPRQVQHFQALAALAKLSQLRSELMMRWDYLVARHGGPTLDKLSEEPERPAIQRLGRIQNWLEFNDKRLVPLIEKLKGCGFNWDAFIKRHEPDNSPFDELRTLGKMLMEELPKIFESKISSIRRYQAGVEVENLEKVLRDILKINQSSIVTQLYRAVKNLDVESYLTAYDMLSDLYRRQVHLERRKELLSKLEQFAPGWAAAIRARQGIHGKAELPGDPVKAWRWKQLEEELKRRTSVSISKLQERINRRTDDLRQITAELIKCKAWAAQLRRTTLEQQQALVGWLNIMKKLGKGYSKLAPYLRAEAARKLKIAREAVPVWIMPLSRVVEQFDPQTTRFDVVIIDEASQCDSLALAALYLADKVVVVGDHEQVSPEGIGQELERIREIIMEYLKDIPNAILYDGRRSIYDIARESFGGTIMLVEHFRCVPEIIQFSNYLCYNGNIRPLRESSKVPLKPHVVPYRVYGASVERKVNKKEAIELASLLVAAAKHPAYENKTFGVISLVGEEQARYIDSLLRRYLSEQEYKNRNILCGTAAQFQGDERDVVFLSLVDASTGTPLPLRETDRFRQRFNVAASRAKDQMWVVYSLDPYNDLKEGDLRRRLIEYALDPEAVTRAVARESARTQSPFEQEVLKRLIAAGYRTYAQWPVGYYVIDLVVEGSGNRVAIECDGDRWHPIEKLPEDLARQAVLERLGWKFIRIRGSEFYRDPDGTMEWVFEQLKAHGISPEGYLPENDLNNTRSELVDEIIRTAALLRREIEENLETYAKRR